MKSGLQQVCSFLHSTCIGSMQSVKHMNDMDETNIGSWCPEIESWPRAYGSRTARGIQVEGFAAMAYGADAMSYFVMGGEKEDAYVEVPEIQPWNCGYVEFK